MIFLFILDIVQHKRIIYINSCRATILQVIYLLTFNVLTADFLTALCDINTLSTIKTDHSVMCVLTIQLFTRLNMFCSPRFLFQWKTYRFFSNELFSSRSSVILPLPFVTVSSTVETLYLDMGMTGVTSLYTLNIKIILEVKCQVL